MSPETLEQIFVQREDIAQDLVDRIILSATTPAKHHSLLIGARGLGKTHLVSLVYYRLDRHQELKDKLMVAWLREDEWGIDSWLDLVVRIFRSLEETKGDTKGLLAQLQEVSISEAETLATQLLTELIGQKTLLLIVENLDDMFAGLGEKGQQKFRSFLQEHQCCTILATTPALFAGVQDLDEPFFELFNQIPLSPLSWEEATVMLQKIADLDGQADLANFLQTPAGKARVRAVHHLAGGNPRVYTLFAQFITRESLDELVQAFMKMLDDLTPYYQSRMKELSNQQRKIVEFLVDRREAVMVKEIATQCFIEQRVVSGQLLQLRNKGYVVARANGRESFYELTEVLMRLCMEVKKYRGQWVELFVDFLRIWYRPAERQEKLAMLRGNGGLVSDEHLEFALMSDADPVLLLVSREFQNCLEQKNRELAIQILSELYAIGGISQEKCQKINELVMARQFSKAINILNLDIAPGSKKSQEFLLEGLFLSDSDKLPEALSSFDLALEVDANNVRALHQKGLLLFNSEKWSEALVLFDKILEIDVSSSSDWIFKGMSLHQLAKYQEAIASYDRHIKFYPNSSDAWFLRGFTLYHIGKYEESIFSYDHAIRFNPDDCQAWINKGWSLFKLGKYTDSISSFDRAIMIDRDRYVSLNNKGIILFMMNNYSSAITIWKQTFNLIQESVDRSSYTVDKLIQRFIKELIPKFTQPAVKTMLIELVQTYIQTSVLTELGTALVRTLKQILAPDISDYTAQQWLALWQELLGERPEMQLPFRLMRTAILYKQYPERKERLWLGLASEERSILDEALEF
jgi:tetratricopeptide (TPR) repeat protein/DNA-binding transcriptional ArsR family regulator